MKQHNLPRPRALVVEGLKRIAAAADEAGVRSGSSRSTPRSAKRSRSSTSIPEALDLLDEADLPQVGIMLDLWHVGDTPTIEADLRAHVDRFTGVHVSDWFADGRPSARCRAQGSRGRVSCVAILADAGWSGTVDVEIFGDPGRPGVVLGLPVEEAAGAPTRPPTGVLPYARR